MKKVLVVDDDVGIFLDYIFAELEHRGFTVSRAASLKEAADAIRDDHFCAVILDLMIPLTFADEEIFKKAFGRAPSGPGDEMKAGLSLLPILEEKGIPIIILTNLNIETKLGAEVYKRIPKHISVYNKPPKEEFYAKLEEICSE